MPPAFEISEEISSAFISLLIKSLSGLSSPEMRTLPFAYILTFPSIPAKSIFSKLIEEPSGNGHSLEEILSMNEFESITSILPNAV